MAKSGKKDIWVAVCLFLASILLQYYFLNPPILSDQMEYYKIAVNFPRLPENPNIASMRLGLILPVALIYRIFGHSELAYYGMPVLSTALMSACIYLLGRAFFNRRVGLAAAIWVILIPNVLLNNGHLLPDMPTAAFFTAGVAVLACMHPGASDFRPLPRKTWLYLLAGLFFGWSYLTKEYIAVLFILIPVLFWALDIPFKRMIPVAVGMLLMLGLEMGVGYAYYRNPMIRFNAASPRETEGHIETDVGLIIRYFPRLLNRRGGIGTIYLWAVGGVGSVYMVVKKNKVFAFLLSWMVIFYLFFTLMGLLPVIFSWEDVVLLRLHNFRYWLPILPPLILSGLGFLDVIFTKMISKRKTKKSQADKIAAYLLVLLLLISAWIGLEVVAGDAHFVRNGADHYLELRTFLRENDDHVEVIWVTRDSRRGYARLLPIYTHDFWGRPVWEGRLKYLNTEGPYVRADEIYTGHVIIDRDFNDPEYYNIPEYLSEIPESWQMVFESENKKLALYSVAK